MFYNDLETIFENILSYEVGPALAVLFKYISSWVFALWIIVKIVFHMSSYTFYFKVSTNPHLSVHKPKQNLFPLWDHGLSCEEVVTCFWQA